ncbi:MAG: hypothetical protein NTX52_01870, partial [Planctomycetota bacterium]|nr:hypothetical protein [Planctomycetota bacterium]
MKAKLEKLMVLIVLLVTVLSVSVGNAKLVAYWELDGDANDSIGGNHGTIFGNPNWVSGRINKALECDGIDDYIDTGYATDLPVWTVAVWVRSPAAPTSGTKATESGPVHRESNYQINWNHGNAAYQGAAGVQVVGTWYPASFGSLEANTWYHLAATYDGEDLKAYKDGVLITNNSSPSGNPR